MSSGRVGFFRVSSRVSGSGSKKNFYVLGLFFSGSGPGTGFGSLKKVSCLRVIFSGSGYRVRVLEKTFMSSGYIFSGRVKKFPGIESG